MERYHSSIYTHLFSSSHYLQLVVASSSSSSFGLFQSSLEELLCALIPPACLWKGSRLVKELMNNVLKTISFAGWEDG